MLIIPPTGKAVFYGKWTAGNPAITGLTKFIQYDTVPVDNQGLLYLGLNTTDLKIKSPGIYMFSGVVSVESSTAGANAQAVISNVTAGISSLSYSLQQSAGACTTMSVELICQCSINDIIQFYVVNSTATARIVQAVVGAATTLSAVQLS
jgi:hypothetical protein